MKRMSFEHILAGLDERGCLGQCAKQRVRCKLTLSNGKELWGENWCMNAQKECPRGPGEGYEKCKTICNQIGHAEQVAARWAEDYHLEGATATLYGHTYFCQTCQEALFAAGVQFLEVGE